MALKEYNPVNLGFMTDKLKEFAVNNFNAISFSISLLITFANKNRKRIKDLEQRVFDLENP